ncbi:FAD-dependent monooxygenase [Brevibacterium yomogidense]|uniref:FAD-dependent monooxygenase n=1 Tax=Brevibacterium yomogidense TaxID=946573 RepID=UPI002FCD0BE2
MLLGDAAHAMTPDLGQGAGQAIEDAATLVLLLRDTQEGTADFDLDSVLRRYSQLRRKRTRTLWRQSRLTGKVAQAKAHSAPSFAILQCSPHQHR